MTPIFGKREHPDEPPRSHEPVEKRVNTVTVECSKTGPEEIGLDDGLYPRYVLADVEVWCTELRRLGAPDDLVLDEACGLRVTLDVPS